MLVNKFSMTLLCFLTFVGFSWGQETMYIEYNNDCMKRLEYKTLKGTQEGKALHYYSSTEAGTALVLETNTQKLVRFASRPSYMGSCSTVNFNKSLVERCNKGELVIRIVGKDNQGYFADYVESISIIKDNGETITYQSFSDGFSYNKTKFINPTANLSTGNGMNEMVMYRGETGLECLKSYTFRKNSMNTCGPYTDITFNDKLGVLQTIDYQNPQFAKGGEEILSLSQLMYINNLPVDNYLGAYCQGKRPKDPMQYSIVTIGTPTPKEDFESKGTTSTAPSIATVPKPAPSRLKPVVSKPTVKTKPSTPVVRVPTPVTRPKKKLKKRDMVDFSNGIPAGSSHGEPTSPVRTPISNCRITERKGYHVVQPKENLYAISKKRGVALDDLVTWNNITDKTIIHQCKELRLTPPQAVADKITLDELESKGKNVMKINQKPAEAKSKGYHRVQEGEILADLAERFGYTPEYFMQFNDLSSDVITPGMMLKTSDCACDLGANYQPKNMSPQSIPQTYEAETAKGTTVAASTALYHTTKQGDTLYSISKKYRVSIARIKDLNRISNPADIAIGAKLLIKR